LGNDVRLKLIESLCVEDTKSINQLKSGLPMSRQNAAKHLRILASAGRVRGVKLGRERLWKFEPIQLDEAHRSLELIRRRWDRVLGELEARVKSQFEARDKI
jgi:Helix-turn-helix domain